MNSFTSLLELMQILTSLPYLASITHPSSRPLVESAHETKAAVYSIRVEPSP